MKLKKETLLSILFSIIITGAGAFSFLFLSWSPQKQYTYPILRVLDGDTVEIAAPYLPEELGQTLKIRINGIDTPEKGRLARCDLEREKAQKAKEFVESHISQSKSVTVTFTGWDKYGGRVLGDVLVDNRKLSSLLVENGHAVEYFGKTKTKDWCKK